MHLNENTDGATDLRQALSSNGCGDSVQRHRDYYFVRAALHGYFWRSRMREKPGNAGPRRHATSCKIKHLTAVMRSRAHARALVSARNLPDVTLAAPAGAQRRVRAARLLPLASSQLPPDYLSC
jgi:hypothetical protein